MSTYVFEGVEVIKTGRVATKNIIKPNGVILKTMTLNEIKPIDESMDWKKWVDPNALFVVNNTRDSNENS